MAGKLHAFPFQNTGMILEFEKEKTLAYTHLSSVSGLEASPENFSTLKFELSKEENITKLSLAITGFPTYEIFKHLEFYWKPTLQILKEMIERN